LRPLTKADFNRPIKIVANHKDSDSYKRKKEKKQRGRLVYLTSGLAVLADAAGLCPRKARIFFE
jgi:hypothetical protein